MVKVDNFRKIMRKKCNIKYVYKKGHDWQSIDVEVRLKY